MDDHKVKLYRKAADYWTKEAARYQKKAESPYASSAASHRNTTRAHGCTAEAHLFLHKAAELAG